MDPDTIAQELEQTIRSAEQNLNAGLKLLENTVAEIVLRNPVSAQASVRYAYENFIRSIPNELQPLRDLAETIIDEFGVPIAVEDTIAIDGLQSVAVEQIASEANRSLGTTLALITAGVIVGTSTRDIANSARARISGVFLETSDRLANRAQRQLQQLYLSDTASREQIQTAVRLIRQQLASVDLSGSLRAAVRGRVSDVVYDFAGAFVLARARRLGYNRFRYAGGVVRNSRDFCINHVGKTYTQAEIRNIWRNQSWSGKRPGDPFVVRGGYNCRHFWVPVKGN
jgi:hypothetical protein